MSIKYYKTTDSVVITAYKQMMAEAKSLLDRATAFCEEFDAKPVIGQDVSGYSFYGVRLNNYTKREDKQLWTKPDPRRGLLSTVRSRASGNAAELRALKEKVVQSWPKPSDVSKAALYKSLGTDWSNLLLHGISIVEREGKIYLATSAKIQNCVEITGSEYQQFATASSVKS